MSTDNAMSGGKIRYYLDISVINNLGVIDECIAK